MAAPTTPNNFITQIGNQQVLLSWDNVAGALTYDVVRSTDNVTFTSLASVGVNQYVDLTAALGTQYFYKVAATNGSGSSPQTSSQSAIPTPVGEMALAQIRLAAQQRADRVNSNFVGKAEWDSYINQAMFELYDILITCYEDYAVAPPVNFVTVASQDTYPLPDGTNYSGAAPFYKLLGVDLAINNANNARVDVKKFNWIDRNNYIYPNTASTIYGVFNLRYRVFGKNIKFIPTPSSGQPLALWYVPRLKTLLLDTDTTDIGISGWIEYVIVRAAKYALDKEESDTTKLDTEIIYLKGRIEESAQNRDAGQPDTISDTRSANNFWGGGPYNNGFGGGGW